MKVTSKRTSDTHAEITIVMDAKDLSAAAEKAIAQLAKEVKVEGFRKGKAPANIAAQHLAPNQIAEATLDMAIRTNVPAIFEQAKLTPIEQPHFEVKKYVPAEALEFTTSVDVFPEIKLGDLKKLKDVKKETVTVPAKDVNEVLDNIANSLAEKKVVKRAAKKGDEVVIDFEGKKDGVAFDGGTAKDFKLVLGSGQFIPGFEEGVAGHEVGDRFDLDLTFPKEYHVKDLAGAKTTFNVLLKQVSEVVKPKQDDEFAAKCGPFKTLDDLKKDIKNNLKAQNEHKAENKYKDDLVLALVKSSKVTAPEVMIEDQLRLIRSDVERNAAGHGMTFEQLLKTTGQTEKEWEKEAKKVAEDRVKASLVLQTLALEEKITVPDEEVKAKIAELKDVYKKDKNALKQLDDPRVRGDIANRLLIEKTLDYLVESAK